MWTEGKPGHCKREGVSFWRCIAQVRVTPELGESYFAAPALRIDGADCGPALVLEMGNPRQAAEWNAIVYGLV